MIPAVGAIGLLGAWIYARSKFSTWSGAIVLLIGFTLTVCGVIVNVDYYTDVLGGSLASPVLNNYDSSVDWQRAMIYLGAPENPELPHRYYSAVIAVLTWIFGVDISVPLLFNSLCYVLLLVVMGAIGWQLTESRKVATALMAITLCMCYLLVQSTVLIKDVPLTLVVALVVLLSIMWMKTFWWKTPWWQYLAMLALMVVLQFLRVNFAPILCVGALLFSLRFRPFSIDPRFVGVIVIATVFRWIFNQWFVEPGSVAQIVAVKYTGSIQLFEPHTMAWDNMTGVYSQLSVFQRIAWLPMSVGVQYMIPFPWTYMSYVDFSPLMSLAHFGFPWYYAGALVVYWIFADMRHADAGMIKLVAWGVAATVATAYVTGGHASRYCLPYLPMLLPAAAWVVCHDLHRRKLWIWLGIFTVLLVVALVVGHRLQTQYL